jgi:hypothetical protein
MEKSNVGNIFQPLYVLAMSLIGLVITLALFVWFYPHPDLAGQEFRAVPQFWVWVFLLGIQTMFFTVVILPNWLQFRELLNEQVAGRNVRQRNGISMMLILAAICFLALMGLANLSITSLQDVSKDFELPQGHGLRIFMLTVYGALTALPIVLSMFLIYMGVQTKAREIEGGTLDEAGLFEAARSLLKYRRILQTSLLILGIIVSILPVSTGALRSILVALDQANDTNFPITLIAVYGLFYTTILIVFYAPVHLSLAEASRKLRDKLCPIADMDSIEIKLKQRAALDEWLETNTGLTQNLRTGIVTLFPLIASLVVSLLGPNASLP